MLVTLPLVPRGAGGRQQHHRRPLCLALRAQMRGIERRLQVAATVEGDLAVELVGEQLAGLADQEGVPDALESARRSPIS